jgi:hypothetical protein
MSGGLENGYRKMKLSHPVMGKVSCQVSHLVLAAFVADRPHGKVADHINAVRDDNRVENLRWLLPDENIRHAATLGRMNTRPGTASVAKLTEDDVRAVRTQLQNGDSASRIAERFNVCYQTIRRIETGVAWRNVA